MAGITKLSVRYRVDIDLNQKKHLIFVKRFTCLYFLQFWDDAIFAIEKVPVGVRNFFLGVHGKGTLNYYGFGWRWPAQDKRIGIGYTRVAENDVFIAVFKNQ